MPATLLQPSRVKRAAAEVLRDPARALRLAALGERFEPLFPRLPWWQKAAAGDGPDGAFENTFADMAFSYVKDRAPRLGDFVVGFQLIDRDPDGSKATGVFGAKAGDAWMYVPVFFLGGKVKGQQLLWLKQSATFVPNKESWVNAVIARRPYELGQSTDDPRAQNPFMPNFRRISRPWEYNLKYSAEEAYTPAAQQVLATFDRWSWPFVRAYARAKLAAVNSGRDLIGVLSTHKLASAALRLCREQPWFKAGLDRFHPGGVEKLAAAAARKRPVFRFAKQAAEKRAVLKLVSYKETVVPPADFSDDEKSKLLTEGRVISDRRAPDKVSRVYSTASDFASSNPPSSGSYDLIATDGGRTEAIVLRSLYPSDGPQCALVIPKKGSARYAHPRRLWAVGPSHVDPYEARKGFTAWLDKKPSVASPQKGKTYVAVGPDGAATYPFTVESKDGDAWEIRFERPPREAGDRPHGRGEGDEEPGYGLAYLVTGTNRSRPVWEGRTLSVPSSFKLVALDYEHGLYPAGQPEDVDAAFGKHANLELFAPETGPVQVRSGPHAWAADRDTVKLALVFQHGLTEEAADAALEKAAASVALARGPVKFLVKYAIGMGPRPGPQIPYFPEQQDETETLVGNPVRVRPALDEDVPAVGPEYPEGAEWYPPDQRALQVGRDAARSGQKDVFDVTAMKALLRRPVADDDVANMVRTLNDLGTEIFQLFAHYDEFEEKYTKDDLPEYEDGLLNVFESLGDVVLFKQSRDSRGTPGLSAGTVEDGPDLGALARE